MGTLGRTRKRAGGCPQEKEDWIVFPGKVNPFKPWRPLALLVAAAVVATACSSTTATPTAAPATQAPAPTATPATAPTAVVSPTTGVIGGSLTVVGTWSGAEQTSFLAMVQPWVNQTGVQIKYTGSRDINAQLNQGIQTGNLPDLAGLPGPGQMAEYQAAGKLVKLDDVIDSSTYKANNSPGLVSLGMVNNSIYGVFIKAAVKGLIWYNPTTVPDIATNGAPKTWTDLQTLATTDASKAKATWCVGLESGAASGWPGTDFIEDFVLRTAGPDVYKQWYLGKVKWSDPKIKAAFQMYGDVIKASYGGPNYILSTNFGNGGDGLFTSPPNCLFHHQASFITTFGGFAKGTAGTTYDFFPFPDIDPQYSGAIEGAGDLFGMFHDTPAARSLMAYLVTPAAQSIWVGRGGALSPNKLVVNYPDDISRRSGELLAGAKYFVFDASDNMPTAMNAEFWKEILVFVKDPTKIDAVLSDLDTVQASAYGS
jgi:alpha-glucoside transport system substrate-binding protein